MYRSIQDCIVYLQCNVPRSTPTQRDGTGLPKYWRAKFPNFCNAGRGKWFNFLPYTSSRIVGCLHLSSPYQCRPYGAPFPVSIILIAPFPLLWLSKADALPRRCSSSITFGLFCSYTQRIDPTRRPALPSPKRVLEGRWFLLWWACSHRLPCHTVQHPALARSCSFY